MYTVIKRFYDKTTKHTYEVGDTYPIDNKKVSKSRLAVLSTDDNKYNEPFIVENKPTEDETGNQVESSGNDADAKNELPEDEIIA